MLNITAFKQHPQKVRKKLLEPIRHVELEESDINLYAVERIFKSALERPSLLTAENMMATLESSRRDDPNFIGSLFYE